MKPLLNWAGSKRQMISQLLPHFPKTFNTYYEPFCGSAAVFLALQPEKAVLNDLNLDLSQFYDKLRYQFYTVSTTYEFEREHFNALGEHAERQRYYQFLRKRFNFSRDPKLLLPLNRLAFNSLWRVNKAGEFNVPFNARKTLPDIPENHIVETSMCFKKAELHCRDFRHVLGEPYKGDFVYIYPPYLETFSDYTSKGFNLKDHEDLSKLINDLTALGVHIAVSGSDNALSREVYKGMTARVLDRASGMSKTKTTELLFTNY